MTVRVLLFASYADALGAPEVQLDVPDGASVADVLDRLRGLTAGKRVPSNPLVAVNERYAPAEQRISATDEIAIIPPVAGG